MTNPVVPEDFTFPGVLVEERVLTLYNKDGNKVWQHLGNPEHVKPIAEALNQIQQSAYERGQNDALAKAELT